MPMRFLSNSAAVRASLYTLDIAFLVALLVLPIAWVLDPLCITVGPVRLLIVHWGPRPVAIPILLAVIRTLLKLTATRRGTNVRGLLEATVVKKATLSLSSVILFFALFETALGVAHFRVDLPPVIIQGRDKDGRLTEEGVLRDSDLMSRYKLGSVVQGRRINSIGFRDREVDPVKKPGTIRIICMGDSVTAQGRPGYSQYLNDLLARNPPTEAQWEALNMGMYGYSSMEGLRLFQKDARKLSPDIVTLYFGWNDHWLRERTDRQQMGLVMGAFGGRIFDALRGKRFFQFMIWKLSPMDRFVRRQEKLVLRVPPQQYQATLTTFVKEIRAAGAIPVLITAPGRRLSEHLIAIHFVTSVEDGSRLHDQYVEITRQVARDCRVELLDLAQMFSGPECDRYFSSDGIHFDYIERECDLPKDPESQPGLERIALELDSKIRDLVLRDEWRRLHGRSAAGGKTRPATAPAVEPTSDASDAKKAPR